MKLLTFRTPLAHDTALRVGALCGDQQSALDLQTAAELTLGRPNPSFHDMLALLDGGPQAMDEARRLVERAAAGELAEAVKPLAQLRLEAPLPRPRSIRDCMTFEKHVVQATRTMVKWRFRRLAGLDALLQRVAGRGFLRPPKAWYERPLYYKGNPAAVVGHEAAVIWPSYSRKLDFELEFGVFIGQQGRDISAEQAHRYVAGYAIFNDFSARDIQLAEMGGRLGPAKSKDFDTSNAIGPYLVTPEDVPHPDQLEMSARVNGETWTRASSADMHFCWEDIIAYISASETLYPGDFIGAGTAPGGCGLELDRWLQPGDTVELEVECLGVLRNQVVTDSPQRA